MANLYSVSSWGVMQEMEALHWPVYGKTTNSVGLNICSSEHLERHIFCKHIIQRNFKRLVY